MSYLTYLLPLAAAAFVIWCAWQWLPLFAGERLEEPAEADGETEETWLEALQLCLRMRQAD